jgi:MmgE/PrpD N-terminal domain
MPDSADSASALHSMIALARGCTDTDLTSLDPQGHELLQKLIRCSLYCVGVGAAYEQTETAPLGAELPTRANPGSWSEGLLAALRGATVGAAADLDPLSVGPSHLALLATVSACVAAQVTGIRADDDIATAVLAGIETASRVRMAVSGGRPGVGFHSSSTFGLIAAAASAARLIGLSSIKAAHALAIALTRMAGLSINSGSSHICLTHFGWAAAHGVEAAWLASEGWTASLDLESALQSYFPTCGIDVKSLDPSYTTSLLSPASTIFKLYPCNVFLNPLVQAVAGKSVSDLPLHLRIPDIPHLSQPDPRNAREARYSAQAVAALAILYPQTYRSFTDLALHPATNVALKDVIGQVTVTLDRGIPTGLDQAFIGVRFGGQSQRRDESRHYLHDLKPWSRKHAAEQLAGLSDATWVDRVFDLSIADAYEAATLAASDHGTRAPGTRSGL